ncbi:MAG: ROK family protein [Treponema sp.]|nr:ROK family protein [Treponema sp.]
MSKRGFIPAHIKEGNRRIIYDLFDDGGYYSKAEICRLTGISAPTVIKIVDSFVEKNILVGVGEGESNVGRKPNLLVRNEKSYYAIGVDFQEEKVRVGLVDLGGKLIGRKMGDLDFPIEKLLARTVYTLVKQMIKEYQIDHSRILGICLGLPGTVDTECNTVEYAYSIGLKDKTNCTSILACLEEALKMPVCLENDINAAAVGEFRARKLDKTKDLIYISLGVGLGAGLVLSGKLRRGINNFAGEIAYTSFNEDYETRKAPKGWMEEKISGDAVKAAIRKEKDTENYISDISKKIALMISNCSVFLDFDLVVIGGLLTKHFGDELLVEIESNLRRTSMFHIQCDKALSEYPELIGCASIVCEKRLKDILA